MCFTAPNKAGKEDLTFTNLVIPPLIGTDTFSQGSTRDQCVLQSLNSVIESIEAFKTNTQITEIKIAFAGGKVCAFQ